MNILKKFRHIILTLVAIILLYGCVPYQGTRITQPPLEKNENLVYLDYALTAKIPNEVLEAEILESGRMRIYTRFYNKQDKTAECQIKIKFKTAEGKVIDQTGWMPFLLPRRESTEFVHTSLTDGVKDFTMLLRVAE